MSSSTTASSEFLALVRKSGLVEEARLIDLFPTPDDVPEDPQRAAAVLIRAGLLTQFQSRQLLAGKFRGFLLGVYKILQPIGKGGMGTVFLAEHTGLKRKVALKVLPNHKAESKLALERFQREARSAAALDHPNIVRLHDISQGNGLHFLVLEYVEGVDLQSLMAKTGPLHFVQAVEYVAQAAAGLHHAHQRGFVHRDIKPANLMLAKDGTVKILDMGLARSFTDDADKLTEQLGDATEVAGTADYISPEQALNLVVDERSDVYSLGATLFALMTGYPPFRGTTAQKLMQHQVADPPSLTKLRGVIPPPLNAVVAKMMAKKPAERLQSMADVIDALSPWLPAPTTGNIAHDPLNTAEIRAARSSASLSAVNVTTPAPVGTLGPMEAPPAKRSRRTLYIAGGVAAAVALAGVAGAAFGLGFGPDDPTRPAPENQAVAPPAVAVTNPPDPAPIKSAPGPTTSPKAVSAAEAAPPAAGGKALYRLDLSRQQPFAQRIQVRLKGEDGKQREHITLDRSGGAPPAGWRAQAWNPQTEGEWAARLVDGDTALGLRNPKGPGSMMGFAPVFTTTAGRVKLRVAYRLDAGKTSASVRFKQNKPASVQAVDVVKLPTTNGAWSAKEFDVDLKGATEGFFEFHNSTSNPDVWLWFREITVLEGGPGAVATDDAPPPGSGRTVYRLDAATLRPFTERVKVEPTADPKNKKVARVSLTGTPPAGWVGRPVKFESEGEWAAAAVDGGMALGLRTASGPAPVMAFAPEFKAPNGHCRLRVRYRIDAAAGSGTVRFKPTGPEGKLAWTVVSLPATDGAWVTQDLDVDLRGATAGYFEFHNGINSPDAWLWLREVVVTEGGTGPAATSDPVTRPAAAPAPARGTTVYRLDLSAVQPFVLSRLGRGETGKVGDGSLPAKWYAVSWQPDNAHEVVAEPRDGAMALGLRSVTGTPGMMLALGDLSATPGRVYEVRFEYMATGQFRDAPVKVRGDGAALTEVGRLTPTSGSWRREAVRFTAGGPAVHVEFHHTGPTGDGNELFVRNVEVVELAN